MSLTALGYSLSIVMGLLKTVDNRELTQNSPFYDRRKFWGAASGLSLGLLLRRLLVLVLAAAAAAGYCWERLLLGVGRDCFVFDVGFIL